MTKRFLRTDGIVFATAAATNFWRSESCSPLPIGLGQMAGCQPEDDKRRSLTCTFELKSLLP